MFKLISNKPIEVADLKKLASQLMLNSALISEIKKKFCRLIKRGTF